LVEPRSQRQKKLPGGIGEEKQSEGRGKAPKRIRLWGAMEIVKRGVVKETSRMKQEREIAQRSAEVYEN